MLHSETLSRCVAKNKKKVVFLLNHYIASIIKAQEYFPVNDTRLNVDNGENYKE